MLILEECRDIAAAGEDGRGCSPGAWIGRCAEDVARSVAAAREEEDVDCLGGPLHGVGSSASAVKAGSEAVVAVVVGRATLVWLLSRGIDVAAERGHVAMCELRLVLERAQMNRATRVERGKVRSCVVYVLNYVDLSACRPCFGRARRPLYSNKKS